MYKLFLTLRYLRKRRIAYFAIAAVTLCVAMVLIVLSVMGGWLDMVKQQARGLLGDVIVDNRDYKGFPLYQEFIDEIGAWPEIVEATPVIYTWGLFNLRSTGQTGTARVVGLRLEDVYEVNAFKRGLFYETYYPKTTHLGPQHQPLLGPDLEAEPLPVRDPDGTLLGEIYQPRLPSPYREALTQARQAHAERARASGTSPILAPADEVERPLNKVLRSAGLPPIPGWYEEADQPELSGEEWPGLILGRDIVAKRHSDGKYDRYYPRGTLVTLTLWATSARGQVDPIPIKQPFRYADDSRTGIYDIDSQHVYCDFELLQKLLQMDATPRVDSAGQTVGLAPARCSQIQIKIAEQANTPNALPQLTRRLEELYWSYLNDPRFELDLTERQLVSRIEALTWQQSQAQIIAPVEKERVLMTIILAIVSCVAFFLILCILYMIVLQKTRDIGIVKAIGGSSGGVALIFVMYGIAAGLAGSILGSVIGVLFVTYINEIQDFLIRVNPSWQVWDLAVYSFDRIPSQVDSWEVAGIVVVAIVAATIGSLAAAVRAGFMEPVKALSYE